MGPDDRTGYGAVGFGLRFVLLIPLPHGPSPLHKLAFIPYSCATYLRRYTELTVGYAESHDQALVGDQVME